MITMTSGLTFDQEAYMVVVSKALNQSDDYNARYPSTMESLSGGGSPVDALSLSYIPMIEENRGAYGYLTVNNILSYVILEVSGLTPRQYLAENILPALGIENDDLFWDHMNDGVEHAFAGIHLTAGQMAKFGQLYLQRGATGRDSQLISEDWIDDSLSIFVEGSICEDAECLTKGRIKGGYLWFDRSDLSPGTWCAVGNSGNSRDGQFICVNSLLDRVVVTQRDDNGIEDDASPGLVELGMGSNDFFVGIALPRGLA